MTRKNCPYWKRNNNHGLKHCQNPSIHFRLHTNAPITTFTSKELILLAEHDWHNREELKHFHPKIPWVSGWITGFLSAHTTTQGGEQ